MLSGLAKCGHCGKALVGQDAKGGQFHYYICGTINKKGSGACQANYLNRDKFEQLVITRIKEHILTYENLRELARLVNEEMDSVAGEYRSRLMSVIDEYDTVSRRLDKLYDTLETSTTLSLQDLSPRIQALRQRQEQLQSTRWELEILLADRRVELADSETVRAYVEDLQNLLGGSSITERKSFVRSFVKEVRVTGDQVTIDYTMPLSRGMISENVAAVPPIVHDGGAFGTLPELLFEKKQLVPALQQLLVAAHT